MEIHLQSLEILKNLISIPSLSRDEDAAADWFQKQMCILGYSPTRIGNNLILKSPYNSEGKKNLLLNSHIDTVKPSESWIYNPYNATVLGDKIIGLGSNDAGDCLVALFAAFRILSTKDQSYNLFYVASAEEEVSGKNGIASVLPELPVIDFAVVGEPTMMNMAVAEKGLMVIDCIAKGKTGHAAREEGENAIYKAMEDINWFKSFKFSKKSSFLGDVKMTVTVINSGSLHNVIPDKCEFVVDVRTNEYYSNSEVLEIIKKHVDSEVIPRSTRLNSSFTPDSHPFLIRGSMLGLESFGSPTTSDQALIYCPSVKIGPGNSARSHSADEYIFSSEIINGINIYLQLLDELVL